jgi:hypothetical protein
MLLPDFIRNRQRILKNNAPVVFEEGMQATNPMLLRIKKLIRLVLNEKWNEQ